MSKCPAGLINAGKSLSYFVIVIGLIGLPVYIVAQKPDWHNPLTQFLLDLILSGASLWVGLTVSNKQAKKNATDRWLPAAETACNELLALAATVDGMRSKQTKLCDCIEEVCPGVTKTKFAPIKHIVKMRCEECSDDLGRLKMHIENSLRNWEAFISNNCEADECERIQSRLYERKQELEKPNGVDSLRGVGVPNTSLPSGNQSSDKG